MSIAGPNPNLGLAQSLAGIQNAERVETAQRKPPDKPKAVRKGSTADQYDHIVSDTEAPEAVRDLKGNDQEEAREDHREHPAYYGPGGQAASGTARPKIDVKV